MAKALFGHVATTDHRLTAEVRRLRTRVAELEAELGRVSAHNDALHEALSAAVTVEDDLRSLGEVSLT